jgi:hypothetical protein
MASVRQQPTRLAEAGDTLAREAAPERHDPWSAPPSLRQVYLLATLAAAVFVAVLVAYDGFMSRVLVFGDSQAYAVVAHAIRRWELADLTPLHFWGLPYLVAAVSGITGTAPLVALVIVCVVSSIIALWCIHRLWGGWPAALLVALSYEWLQRSLLGGAEPVFLALIAGAFVATRSERWKLAALLAALATTVRPQGILALVAIAIGLALERRYRALAAATLIGAGIGLLYMLPFAIHHGDPLANFHAYQDQDWHTGSPLSVPLVALVRAMFESPVPWTTVVREAVWILICVAGAIAMLANRRFRQFAVRRKVEAAFAGLYLMLLFSYNSYWSLLEFARFAIPVLPLVFLALHFVVRLDRRVLWLVTPVAALFGAMSVLNVRQLLGAF